MASAIMFLLFGLLCAIIGWFAHGTYIRWRELDD